MTTSKTDEGTGADRQRHAADDRAGDKVPKQPADTNAGGEARNDTGEDNQRQKGERPAQDYVRR